MPTYHYRCASCEQHIEVVQSMTDDPVTDCGACGGVMQKVLRPVGIVLKGSGFYRTDSRSPATAPSETKSDVKSETKSDAKSGKKAESKGETKSEPKKAAGPPPAATSA